MLVSGGDGEEMRANAGGSQKRLRQSHQPVRAGQIRSAKQPRVAPSPCSLPAEPAGAPSAPEKPAIGGPAEHPASRKDSGTAPGPDS